MVKLLLNPDQDSYRLKEPKVVIHSEVPGGPGRYRIDVLEPDLRLDCKFTLSPNLYQYFRAFYNFQSAGTQPFEMDLVLETAALRTHTVRFLPGGWSLSKVTGQRYEVRCRFEVERNAQGLDNTALMNNYTAGDVTALSSTKGLRTLLMLPEAQSYQVVAADDHVATDFGPSKRSRRNHKGTEAQVQAEYVCDANDYNYLRAFFRHHSRARPFFLPAVWESSTPLFYFARIVPGSFELAKVDNAAHRVKLDYNVLPYDPNFDMVEDVRNWTEPTAQTQTLPGNYGGEEFT